MPPLTLGRHYKAKEGTDGSMELQGTKYFYYSDSSAHLIDISYQALLALGNSVYVRCGQINL